MFQPNQPKHYQYRKSKYKETDQTPWVFQLVYMKNAEFCFYCCKYLKTHAISERVEPAFTVTCFRNWKRAFESKKGFIKHQSSGLHKKGKDKFHPEIPNQDLSEMMSSNLKNDRKNNQAMLLKILPSIEYLGKYLVPYLKCLYRRSNQVFNIHYT